MRIVKNKRIIIFFIFIFGICILLTSSIALNIDINLIEKTNEFDNLNNKYIGSSSYFFNKSKFSTLNVDDDYNSSPPAWHVDRWYNVIDAIYNSSVPHTCSDYLPLTEVEYPVYNLNTSEGFLTIQSAIDDSDTLSDHHIYISNGTYYENVVINKPRLTLIGENRNTTIINNNGSGICCYIQSNAIVLKELYMSLGGSAYEGVRIESDYNKIFDCIITGAKWGVFNVGHNNRIENCTINWNQFGVRAFNSNNGLINNCIFLYNLHNGILIKGSSSYTTVKNCNVSYTRDSYSIAISFEGLTHHNIISNTSVFNNSYNGITIGGSHHNVHNNSVTYNLANIDMQGGPPLNNTVADNYIAFAHGSFYMGYGIRLTNEDNKIIRNNILSNNRCGILVEGASGYPTNNNIISGNFLYLNSHFQIYMNQYVEDNLIYNNYFNNSGNNVFQFVGYNNIWNVSKNCTLGPNIYGGPCLGGNYWFDYLGHDTDGDGLGNTILPYGPGDYLPLTEVRFPVYNLDTGEGFLTIQSAISDSDTLNGHTIYVSNGVYYENININKQLKITGENQTNTIINGSGVGDVIYIISDWTTINNFTIQNSGPSGDDAGIHASCSYLNITNCTVINNRYGIYFMWCDNNKITNCKIDSNDQTGLYIWGGPSYIINNNIIINNSGSGIYVSSHQVTIKNNIISNNYRGISTNDNVQSYYIYNNNITYNNDYGIGGGYIWSTVANNYVAHHTSGSGIGIGMGHTNTIKFNNIRYNKVGIRSGDQNTIRNNTIFLPYHSGIYIQSEGSTFYGNNITVTGSVFGFYFDDWLAYPLDNTIYPKNTVNGAEIVLISNVHTPMIIEDLQSMAPYPTYFSNRGIINLVSCSNITLKDSIIGNHSGEGIFMINADKNIIENCTIYNNSNSGIQAGWGLCDINLIKNCTIYNNVGSGIHLGDSNSNTICYNNVHHNNNNGIGFAGNSNKAFNNTAAHNNYHGIHAIGNNHKMFNNSVYSNNYNGIRSDTTGGSIYNNYLSYNGWGGIAFGGTSTIVHNNTLMHNWGSSISLAGSGYIGEGIIKDNIIVSNYGKGIKVDSAYFTILRNNISENNNIGIEVYSGPNSNCKITENIINSNNKHGICLIYIQNVDVNNNSISLNLEHGITATSGHIIHNNSIIANTLSGINVGGNSQKIWNNNISDNIQYGIRIWGSYIDNVIYNNILNNTNNCIDTGSNKWNISKNCTAGLNIIGGPCLGGNYWNDYLGHDNDGDGLGNTNIPHSSGDKLPLTQTNYAPIANFTYNPSNPNDCDIIQLNDLSSDIDGIIVNWSWDFGDGNISYNQNPTHSYNDNGTYIVYLTVEDDDETTNTTCFTVTIQNIEPNADFEYTPTTPTNLDIISFIDNSSDGCYGNIVNWSWDLGDGNISYNQNPTHTYQYSGEYNVSLTVTDDDGSTNITTKTITIYFEVIMEFKVGWNLITTTAILDITMASQLAENITGCLTVNKWDSINQTYKPYIVGGPPDFDFTIFPGLGLFVEVTENSTLSLAGLSSDPVNIGLYIPWNLIGWYNPILTTASSLAENISGCLTVNKWDNINQTYKPYIVGGPPDFDFVIYAGLGLFVEVDVESTWSGEG